MFSKKFNLIYILLIRCKCSRQLTIYEKKFKRINICFMINIWFIFWRQCEIYQCQFRIPQYFCILFSTPLNKANLILATQSKLLFKSNYLKSTVEDLSFQILFVPNASKTFGTLFPHYRWLTCLNSLTFYLAVLLQIMVLV